MKVPGVKAVITGKDLDAAGLGWLPTFHGFDKQMVLAIGKVLFQYQEVAAVFAESRAAAVDGAEAVQVEYTPLPVVADPFVSKTDKVLLRPDRESKTNHIFHWEVGDKDGAAKALAASPKRIKQRLWFQRCHPAPLEPCGCVAFFDTMGRLQFYVTSQAPHVYRTALALVTGIAEDKIHVISPDLGGGFGNKVPVYPGYVCAIVGALKIGRPVKWIETRTENLTSTGFARDYHMDVEIGATADGRVTALHVATTADHGAFDAAADPSKYPAGIFGIVTGSYDFPVAHAEVDAYFTNKAPGGIAYRCSFRVTEASYAIERGMDILADELGIDASELRRKNFIRKEQFPYPSALGFTYDSGDYHRTLDLALEKIGYSALLKEQSEKRAKGELMGIGFSTFTEVVGAGPSKHFDILGIKMFDSAEIRIHPTGAGIVRTGAKSQGQGHETTWAQIVAEELGLDPQTIMVEEGDTDTAPYGLGTYASRSTPVAGAAVTMAARRVPGKGAQDRRASARGRRGRRGVGRLQVPGERRAGQDGHDEGRGVRRLHEHGAERAGARGDVLLRPAQHDLSQRDLHRGGRRRSRDRRREGPSIPRGGRLRDRHQPDDRRGPDPRRPDRRVRDGLHAGDSVRQRGESPEHELHRLPRADVTGDAALGDGEHRDAEPAPSDGCEGRRREPERGQPGGIRQRGHRRVVAARRASHRHARQS